MLNLIKRLLGIQIKPVNVKPVYADRLDDNAAYTDWY